MHPIAFHIGPLPVHWYGILIAVAFIAGLMTATRRGLRDGLSPDAVADLGPWLIVGSIVGARAWHVVSYWREEYAGKPFSEIFMVQHGGLVFYGGLVGALLTGILYARRKHLPIWKLADCLAPSVALGSVFGRLGCLMNGCCYGRACSLPWAIHFPSDHATYPQGVHPTEIYDALLNLGFYFFLAWLYRRKKFDGQIFAIYLAGYALLRSFVELFRGDYLPRQYLAGWLTPAQVASIGMLLAALALFWVLPRRAAPAAAPAAPAPKPQQKRA